MSTSPPAPGSGRRHESGAALPSSAAHPTSPGPNPDDLDDDTAPDAEDTGTTPAVSPTNPGPNPDDINH